MKVSNLLTVIFLSLILDLKDKRTTLHIFEMILSFIEYPSEVCSDAVPFNLCLGVDLPPFAALHQNVKS